MVVVQEVVEDAQSTRDIPDDPPDHQEASQAKFEGLHAKNRP